MGIGLATGCRRTQWRQQRAMLVAAVWEVALRFVCTPTGIRPNTAIKQKAAIPMARVNSTSENAAARIAFSSSVDHYAATNPGELNRDKIGRGRAGDSRSMGWFEPDLGCCLERKTCTVALRVLLLIRASPRGLNWTAFHETVLRAGAGISYGIPKRCAWNPVGVSSPIL